MLAVKTHIVEMTVKNFYARRVEYTTLAQKVCWVAQPFETRCLFRLLSELKILVSVVRFRPGPPESKALVSDNGGFLHFRAMNLWNASVGKLLNGKGWSYDRSETACKDALSAFR